MLPISQYLQQRIRPIGEPAMLQSWRDLCFLHYPVDPDVLRPHIPVELEIDTFPDENGVEWAWIGIVAFTMNGVRFPGSPALPWLSAFPETNVRTYVHHNGMNPGVWFFSLDASRLLACEYAKKCFGLNYLHSEMSVIKNDKSVNYQIRRLDEPHASMSLSYIYSENWNKTEPETLDFWLIERYLLYAELNGELMQGSVHHKPYEISQATVLKFETDLPESIGLPGGEILHRVFSPGADVEVFQLRKIGNY
jgi:uncharacterized protein YqjF (DUF2071 family)